MLFDKTLPALRPGRTRTRVITHRQSLNPMLASRPPLSGCPSGPVTLFTESPRALELSLQFRINRPRTNSAAGVIHSNGNNHGAVTTAGRFPADATRRRVPRSPRGLQAFVSGALRGHVNPECSLKTLKRAVLHCGGTRRRDSRWWHGPRSTWVAVGRRGELRSEHPSVSPRGRIILTKASGSVQLQCPSLPTGPPTGHREQCGDTVRAGSRTDLQRNTGPPCCSTLWPPMGLCGSAPAPVTKRAAVVTGSRGCTWQPKPSCRALTDVV